MSLTVRELDVISEGLARAAINDVIHELMMNNGRVDIGVMPRTSIDYVIHLLRQYKAVAFGASNTFSEEQRPKIHIPQIQP